ncbi:tRNA-dihydrouridine synthase [Quadrisphaera sp. DSM 44207]|uniref:tRNA-dihydrouridine synthase n=1 Tax=Quadrisphaera sp. DSM 44207 TaxID=1881057 RepID=UPI000888639D|nr:tRNA-dihydrouridine synthase [Quadrisphaera sp. DSM 44207]SDQ42595.1 hypothetical protein SAMN05428996_1657 [Quadrisphaera sp. DSM 44207]
MGQLESDDGRSPMTVRRSARVALAVTPALAVALGGCASGASTGTGADEDGEPTSQAVCVDEDTGARVDDDECDDDGTRVGGFGWYFLPLGARIPAVGSRVSGGSYSQPSGTAVRGGAPRAGGTVSADTTGRGGTVVRGGFGGSGSSGG